MQRRHPMPTMNHGYGHIHSPHTSHDKWGTRCRQGHRYDDQGDFDPYHVWSC